MAKDTGDENQKSKDEKKGGSPLMAFLCGAIAGVAIGVLVGWSCRPPSSFEVEELRGAVEEKFLETSSSTRQGLADFAENMARRLRDKNH